MKKKHFFASIQNRILAITLSCILVMCILISSVSYYIFHSYLQQSKIQSSETSLRLLSDTINTSISDVYRMVRFCQTKMDVAEYIENNPNPNSVLSVETYDRLNEEYNNNASSSYMPRVAIVSHENFLQIVNSTYSSTADLAAGIPELPFFETLLSAPDYDFSTGFIADPFHRKGRSVLPILRPITYQYSGKQAGYLFIEVSSDLFTTPLKRYSHAQDSSIFLSIGEHTYLYEDGTLTEFFSDYETIGDMSHFSLSGDTTITRIKNEEGLSEIMVTTPLNMPGCYITQSISHEELNVQSWDFVKILIGTLFGVFTIGIILVFIMNRMINVPVRKLRTKMIHISEGDFSRDPSIEWEHELGEIGRGINDLSENVDLLMNKRLEDEKQSKQGQLLMVMLNSCLQAELVRRISMIILHLIRLSHVAEAGW